MITLVQRLLLAYIDITATPLPVSRWIGKRTIHLLWGVHVSYCFKCVLTAWVLHHVDLTACCAASCVSDGFLVALASDRWRHVFSTKVTLFQSSAMVTNEGEYNSAPSVP
ncbi:hypothetical protein TNCV_2915961 [Trichonephila clavipes]|nr:hypothetical protein TNCV_2915961 [Trichonephila clavipes]